ncbi:MAG: glycoside hydrolase family 16 protein [Candidatus Nealsonbacteria bacterium]|nr:glycoside hydrolase family 16 protein [Candidatus Nealsonbacteria bacterium]
MISSHAFLTIAIWSANILLSTHLSFAGTPQKPNITEPSDNPKGFPENPIKKVGWDLVANDEFDGPKLNEELWIPDYLPGRYVPPYPPHYYFTNGAMHLTVNHPEARISNSGYQSVSSIQTYNCYNLHLDYSKSKPEDVPTINKFTQLYGWYEIRAKHVGPMHHVAFWALEARPKGSEIDITEDPASPAPNWHHWGSPPFPAKRKRVKSYDAITTKKQRATEFHIYALEVHHDGARIYHDNQLVEEVTMDWKQRGETPLMFILGIYGSKRKEDHDKKQEYVIDYFRAYRKTEHPSKEGREEDAHPHISTER